jgi:hypothetical protein
MQLLLKHGRREFDSAMKVFDRTDVRITRAGDSVVVTLPIEYEGLEGFSARLQAATEDGKLVFLIHPDLDGPVRETVDELWRDLRILFSGIADIGAGTPWQSMEIVWETREADDKFPISAAEVIEHRRIYCTKPLDWDKEGIRKSIHDTMTKLCELSAMRLGFRSRLFSVAFGDAVANKFSLISCTYGTLDILCELFSEEFNRACDDRYWSLTSPRSRDAVAACYRKIKRLEDHPEEFEKERDRVGQKWNLKPKPP